MKDNLNVLGKNEKYKTFSVLIENEVTKVDKEGNENIITISSKIKFIDSARFIATPLSNLVDNLVKGIHKIKCKDCDCFEYETVNDNLINYKCLFCNKNYSDKIGEELKNQFKNTFKFSNNDINKFILLLGKGIYTYDFMDEWESINKISLPEKEEFYSNLNMENITDSELQSCKKICNDFEIKNLVEYHDLYITQPPQLAW